MIEENFKGYRTIEQNVKIDDGGSQSVQLNYFESITSDNKVFKKVVGEPFHPTMDSRKMFELKASSSDQPFPDEEEID